MTSWRADNPMTESVNLTVGSEPWTFTLPVGKLLSLSRTAEPQSDASPGEMMRAALEEPLGLGASLRSAVTPDDQIVIVVEERVPRLLDLLVSLFQHLVGGGIRLGNVTLLVPATSLQQPWLDDLPDELGDIHLEVHDPENREKIAYLATTKSERRVYLNRKIVEADLLIVLSRRGFDPKLGYSGAAAFLFPQFSDAETIAAYPKEFSTAKRPEEPNPLRVEAKEILKLLGAPFLVQVIEGYGDSIAEVLVGLPTSTTDGVASLKKRWLARVERKADLVIAAVAGSADRIDFRDLATAAATARRALGAGGQLVLLTTAAPPLDDSGDLLLKVDGPAMALKRIAAAKPDDAMPGTFWAYAAKKASLYVASGWPDELVEELFATPIHTAGEVQRLIDAADTVLFLPDAHKMFVEVGA